MISKYPVRSTKAKYWFILKHFKCAKCFVMIVPYPPLLPLFLSSIPTLNKILSLSYKIWNRNLWKFEKMKVKILWRHNAAFGHLSSYQLLPAITFVTAKVTHHSYSHVIAAAWRLQNKGHEEHICLTVGDTLSWLECSFPVHQICCTYCTRI